MIKVLITGSTGLIGRHLRGVLTDGGVSGATVSCSSVNKRSLGASRRALMKAHLTRVACSLARVRMSGRARVR